MTDLLLFLQSRANSVKLLTIKWYIIFSNEYFLNRKVKKPKIYYFYSYTKRVINFVFTNNSEPMRFFHLIILMFVFLKIKVATQPFFNIQTLHAQDLPFLEVLGTFEPKVIDTLMVLELSNPRYGQKKYSLMILNTHELDTDGYRISRIILLEKKVEIASIQLPSGETVKNFEVNKMQETIEGFVILTSWGGGNYLYNVNFYSDFKGKSFVFTKVETEMYGPDIEYESLSIERFKKEIPFEEFVLMAYFDGDYDDNIINSAKDK